MYETEEYKALKARYDEEVLLVSSLRAKLETVTGQMLLSPTKVEGSAKKTERLQHLENAVESLQNTLAHSNIENQNLLQELEKASSEASQLREQLEEYEENFDYINAEMHSIKSKTTIMTIGMYTRKIANKKVATAFRTWIEATRVESQVFLFLSLTLSLVLYFSHKR